MKKNLTLLIFCLLSLTFCNAQKTEKVKGNRNVSTLRTNLDAYHTIILDEDFDIEFIYNENPYIEIETDENLHDFIKFQVIDSVLTFNKPIKITSKKKLNIKVTYNEALRHIETTDDAEILSLATLNLKKLSLKTRGNSQAGLTVNADYFEFDGDDKSKVKLNVTSKNSTIALSGNSTLETLVNTSELTSTIYQRAILNIEGTCKNAEIELDNHTEFNGKKFTINTCNVICNISGNATLEVVDQITIEATGASFIYLYQNPKIVINKFTDTVKLEKKLK